MNLMGIFKKIVEDDSAPDHSKGISTMEKFDDEVRSMQVMGDLGPIVISDELFKMFSHGKDDCFTYGSPGVMVQKYKG